MSAIYIYATICFAILQKLSLDLTLLGKNSNGKYRRRLIAELMDLF